MKPWINTSMRHQYFGLILRWTSNKTLVVIILANLVVALTGFVKDLSVASYLGTTMAADAFADAYFIVDTISVNVCATALWIAAASTFGISWRQLDVKTHRSTVRASIIFTLIGSILLSTLLLCVRRPIVHFMAESARVAVLTNGIYLGLIPMALAYPTYMVLAGALQSGGSFLSSALAPSLLNLSVLVGTLILFGTHLTKPQGLIVLGWAHSFGAILMLTMLVGLWIRWEKAQIAPLRWREIGHLYSRTTLVTGYRVATGYASYLILQQFTGFIERYLAGKLGHGTVAALSYSYRVSQVPNWVLVSAMMMMVLPNISSALNQNDRMEATALVARSVRLVFVFCLPAATVLSVWSRPLIALLFERGNFGTESVHLTGTILSSYAWGITSQALAAILFRTVSSTGNLRWPVVSAVAATAVNVIFDFGLVSHLGPWTFGIGSCLWGLTSSAILWFYLRGSGKVLPFMDVTDIVSITLSNLIVLLSCAGLGRLWLDSSLSVSRWSLFVHLVLAAFAVGLIYITCLSFGQRRLKKKTV